MGWLLRKDTIYSWQLTAGHCHHCIGCLWNCKNIPRCMQLNSQCGLWLDQNATSFLCSHSLTHLHFILNLPTKLPIYSFIDVVFVGPIFVPLLEDSLFIGRTYVVFLPHNILHIYMIVGKSVSFLFWFSSSSSSLSPIHLHMHANCEYEFERVTLLAAHSTD